METEKKEKGDTRYPRISDKELEVLYDRIKPAVRGSHIEDKKLEAFIGRWAEEKGLGGKELATLKKNADETLFWIKGVHPRNIAFAWGPDPIGVTSELKEIGRITTYHTWAYYGFFKPTIGEVLAQIPAKIRGSTVAFEVVPPVSVEGILTPDEKYQHAETILYGLSFVGSVKGVKNQLLQGERQDWDAKKDAAEEAAEAKELRKRAAEARSSILKYIDEATLDSSGQVSGHTLFSEDFETLFDVQKKLHYEGTDYDTVESVLKQLKGRLETGELGYGRAALALEELRNAVGRDLELAQDGWEVAARGIAIGVLERLHRKFMAGSIDSAVASGIAWKVRPFIQDRPFDQLFWAAATKPFYEGLVRDYRDEDRDGLMDRLRK